MPNPIFPAAQRDAGRGHSANTQPGLWLRLRTRWKRGGLDEALADGVDPAQSAELTVRAAQLRSTIVRSQLADALENTLDDARRSEPFRLRLRPHRAEIRACADELLAVVRRLRDFRQPVDVRGAAKTALLVATVTSPLDREERLRRALRSALLALDTQPEQDRRHAA